MKKLIVMGIVSLMFAPSFAHVGDGDLILGGAFSILSDGKKTDDGNNVFKSPKTFRFILGPHVHYMLSDDFSVGGKVFVDMSKTTNFEYDPLDPENEQKEKDSQTGFGIGPVARYWWHIGEKRQFGLFAEAGFTFATYGGKDEEYDFGTDELTSVDDDRMHRISLYIVPGMFYAPTERFFFEVTFGGFGLWYNNDITKVEGTDTKIKDGYFKLGGDLDELFFGNTAVGINFIL